MEKTVLIVLDAFRHDYINRERTPFLYSLIGRGRYYKKIVPSYGFCERTEIMVGLEASESNYFTALGYDENNSPYKHLRWLLRLLSFVERNVPLIVKKVVRRLLWEYVSRREKGFASVNIPLECLAFFALTEDGKGSLINTSAASIINIVRENGRSVDLSCFTSLEKKMVGGDSQRIENLISSLENDDFSLHLLYISSADHFGHKYGPDSEAFKAELTNLDRKLEFLYNRAMCINRELNWLFVGDHGMTQVEHRVNIVKKVDRQLSDFRFGTDYIYFADSTVFRVWFLDDSKKAELGQRLDFLFSQPELLQFGKLSSERDLRLNADRVYGDYLWLAKPGVVISPDFFNSAEKPINGMHGYDPALSESCLGTALILGPGVAAEKIPAAPLTAIYGELKNIVSRHS